MLTHLKDIKKLYKLKHQLLILVYITIRMIIIMVGTNKKDKIIIK